MLALLDGRVPAASARLDVVRPFALSAYVGAVDLPVDLVTSVRVIVRIEDDVVVCTNTDGRSHPWPGGRVEAGETWVQTACREVREETGWELDPASVEHLGFLVWHNEGEPLPPYPHPDALHLVTTARAVTRAAEEWTDTEGYEVSSRLVPLATAAGFEDDLCVPFLELLRDARA